MAAFQPRIWSTRRSQALTNPTRGVWTVVLLQGWVIFTETLHRMQRLFVLDLQVLLLSMEVIMKLRQQVAKVNIKIFLWTSQIFFTLQIFSF